VYDYLIYGAVGFIILILIFYMYAKDSEASKKFFLYEKSIEDLNKKIYDLEKKLDSKKSDNYTKEEIKEYIDEVVEENLQKITAFVLTAKKEQDAKIEDIRDEVLNKLQNFDEKVKNFNSLPDAYQSNEKKIINLYHKGLSVSEIARNLRLGIGEVELVLKIEGIK